MIAVFIGVCLLMAALFYSSLKAFDEEEFAHPGPWTDELASQAPASGFAAEIPSGACEVVIFKGPGMDTYLFIRFTADAATAKRFFESKRYQRSGEGVIRPPWLMRGAPEWWQFGHIQDALFGMNGIAEGGAKAEDLPLCGEYVLWDRKTNTVYYHYWDM